MDQVHRPENGKDLGLPFINMIEPPHGLAAQEFQSRAARQCILNSFDGYSLALG